MGHSYTWKKCVCKKTHISGDNAFIENSIYKYKQNGNFWSDGGIVISFSIYRDTIESLYITDNGDATTERGYTYLEKDFYKHFVDLAQLRDMQLEEVLND